MKINCNGEIDQLYWNDGYYVIGVDEAGRGPLAGDMFVSAVCFLSEENLSDIGLNDSKKLTNDRRISVEEKMKPFILAKSVRKVTVHTINKGSSLQDLLNRCMIATVRDIVKKINSDKFIVLIDGLKVDNFPYEQVAMPKLDTKSWSVAAASILAKNAQVRAMAKWDEKYPEYGFKIHNGYGTDLHRARIVECGFCEAHRVSWISDEKILKWKKSLSTKKKFKMDKPRPKKPVK